MIQQFNPLEGSPHLMASGLAPVTAGADCPSSAVLAAMASAASWKVTKANVFPGKTRTDSTGPKLLCDKHRNTKQAKG